MEVCRRRVLQAMPGLVFTGAAAGQSPGWKPDRPVKLVVPFAAGAAADLLAGQLAPLMATALGQAVVVRNMPGEAGRLAAAHIALSQPDGLALLLGSVEIFAFSPHLVRRVGYDPLGGFAPIGLVGTSPMVLLASRHSGITDLAQLRARARDGLLTIGTAARGSALHMGAVTLMLAIGGVGDLVPYPSETAARELLQAGLLDVMVDQASDAIPAIQLGARPLALTGAARLPEIATVPTSAELGLGTLDLMVWSMLAGPRGTPPEIVAALARALDVALENDMLAEYFATHAVLLPDAAERGPAAAAALIAREHERWGRIVRAAGIENEG